VARSAKGTHRFDAKGGAIADLRSGRPVGSLHMRFAMSALSTLVLLGCWIGLNIAVGTAMARAFGRRPDRASPKAASISKRSSLSR